MDIRTTNDKVKETLRQCNLCTDVVRVVFPNEPQNWFMHTEDVLYRWYKEMEDNVKRGGGYMIDEWRFADGANHLMDLRARVKLELDEKKETAE